MAPLAPSRSILIWDIYIRLFHWLLVALLGFSWWSGERHEMEWHRLSGYGIFFLLIFRVYWGVFGTGTARFAHFVRSPHATFVYLKALGQHPHRTTVGHNPAGGWSVLLLLATVMAMVIAGLFAVDVDGLESGPLSDYVSFDQGRMASDLHAMLFSLLLLLVALHIAAILYHLLRLRDDLVGPMFHGRRTLAVEEEVDLPAGTPWRALVGLLIAAACTWAIGFR
ncbi:cytochrome b/b6 domain-containing protein [Sphingobium sp. MK2]|uniref:cytochrome b/b6 domain-containing protein n=1 Tax=Sphingobium sp. MK2 TaxID=3116540 RepID=UPI0032E35B9D